MGGRGLAEEGRGLRGEVNPEDENPENTQEHSKLTQITACCPAALITNSTSCRPPLSCHWNPGLVAKLAPPSETTLALASPPSSHIASLMLSINSDPMHRPLGPAAHKSLLPSFQTCEPPAFWDQTHGPVTFCQRVPRVCHRARLGVFRLSPSLWVGHVCYPYPFVAFIFFNTFFSKFYFCLLGIFVGHVYQHTFLDC